jgi:hypothetical protein
MKAQVCIAISVAVITTALAAPPGRIKPEMRPRKRIPPELPFVIGPKGYWSGQCTLASTPAGSDREISGCITAFTFRPGVVDVTVRASGLGTLDYLNLFACQTTTACPAVQVCAARATTGFFTNPLGSNPSGVAK